MSVDTETPGMAKIRKTHGIEVIWSPEELAEKDLTERIRDLVRAYPESFVVSIHRDDNEEFVVRVLWRECEVCQGIGQLGTGIGQECGACEGTGRG